VVSDTYTPLPNESIGSDYYNPIAYEGCEYPTFALNIQIDEHYTATDQETGGSMMEMHGWASDEDTVVGPYNQTINIPFYQYMSQSQFDLLRNTIDSNNYSSNIFSFIHHGFTSQNQKNQIANGQIDGISVVKLPNPTGSAYQDYAGVNITDPYVYGVQKALGPYSAAYYPLESVHLAPDGESLAGQLSDFNGFAQYANEYMIDSLNAQYTDVPLPHIPGCQGETESGDGGDVADHCGEEIEQVVFNDLGDNGYEMFFDIMEIGCLDHLEWESDPEGGDAGGTPTWPHPVVSYFQIYSLAAPKDSTGKIPEGGLVKEVFRDSIFNSDGSINLPPFTLPKGLYNMVLGFKDHSTLPILFEISKPAISQYDLSNLLEPTIYPVPFRADFTTKMKADATIKFTYSIYDEDNKTYFKHDFFLKKDETKEIRINAENFKKGLIFHRFVFSDGSEKIITTEKQ
jgi:hypothetical protein